MALHIAKSPLVGPILALNGWTLFMEAWMYATRIPAIEKAVKSGKMKTGSTMTKESMNEALPHDVRWKADNYNHLHEQPTQFYAIALSLALIGADDKINTKIAWAYVGIRVAHSLVQAIANKIMLRFGLFITSSVALTGLVARGALVYFG